MNSRNRRVFSFLALAMVAALALMRSFQPARAADADSVFATYAGGIVHVTIPFQLDHAGPGVLTVELLDPEDQVLAKSERRVDAGNGKGSWQQDLTPSKALHLDELAWHRLHYRFAYRDQNTAALDETESISRILRTPVIHILGQRSYLAGAPAAVRVIVADSKNEVIPGVNSIRIDLLTPDQKTRPLFNGKLNERGTADAHFTFPAALTGNFSLRYAADTAIGSTEFTQQVRLEDKVSLMLTTEKPVYQPGQTIHVRALALDRANHNAANDRKLTFEVEDSRGNKVFKNATQTDQFGVASTEFALADEVNLGTYHLRAVMAESSNTAEIALNVERYVLPKFKVAVELGGKNENAKRGYRPGDHVTGTVRANYFFGNPVTGGQITVKASGMDVAQFEAASVQGKTDNEGVYHFDLALPRYFAGRPLSQGAARVLIEAAVKDSAGHSETRGEGITVSQSPLLVMAIPEGGTLIPHLENQVFLLASYPDGTPASAQMSVRAAGNPDQRVATDAGGVAVIRLNAGNETRTIDVDASDAQGNRATNTLQLDSRQGTDQILLRTEHAVYHAGDRISLKVFSTKSRGTAYVDVVKEGQTILTRDLDLVNGQADLALTATADLAGTLDFNAYLFGQDAQPVADHRLVFVQPADELKIEATADTPVYKPGDDARVRFRVTNSRGEGVQAALGVQVVDEAVFALAEKQPGFAKVFFYLEQEAMKPRYEIHSIGMPEVTEAVPPAQVDQRDRAARALFSATELVSTNKFETEVGRTVPLTKQADYAARYRTHFVSQVLRRYSENLGRAYAQNPEGGDLVKVAAKLTNSPDSLDAWGTALHFENLPGNRQLYIARSAGSDKQFNTPDDLVGSVELQTIKTVGSPSAGPSRIDVKMEHNRGAFNGRAAIAGTVLDQSGAALSTASIKLHKASGGDWGTAIANPNGAFSLSGVPAGDYVVEVSARGETVSSKVSVQERDRVTLTAVLHQNSAVTVLMSGESKPVAVLAAKQDAVLMVNGTGIGFGGGIGLGRLQQGQQGGGGGVGRGGGVNRIGDFAGGVIGGIAGGIAGARAVAAPPPPVMEKLSLMDAKAFNAATLTTGAPASAAPHVRSYFPEALYINPEIITDKNGLASIVIPLADSITTWRMAMLASTVHGALGSGTSSIKVFQDFFVDLDLPVTLTQGDRISLPVAVYNYSGSRGNVSLKLQPEDWYSLVADTADKTLAVDSGQVGGSEFSLQANRIGKFKLTLNSRMAGGVNRADIVVREIEVVPNGREQSQVFNGRLESAVNHAVNFPAASIPDSSAILVRLYPGPLSQVIEGMDSLLRMPGGCFEQTSSSTYPNVLALDYMKRTKKLTPEVHAKAEGFIANGYQRLLTFEVPGGGFSWFGAAPANKILTSYGLMEFYDMSQVHDVDPKLIQRTQQWLASQQQPDGSWKPDTNFINEGATNRYNSDVLRITAYIAWSLENTGFKGPAVAKARQFVTSHLSGSPDTYTLAVVANFAVDGPQDRDFLNQAMKLLLDARTEKDDQTWWTAQETSVYATGSSATVETTGLALQALLKWGQSSETARKALAYIASKKDASGAWGTTQATIMALRALLLATEKSAADVRGTVEVTLNGKSAERLTLTPDNNDLLHQFVFKQVDPHTNTVSIKFDGKGGLAYQVVGRTFVPWTEKPANEPLSINVAYDRTRLAQDDVATATATVRNNLAKSANMVMVDLGIPPGFDLLTEDLQSYQEKSATQKSGRLEKFSLTATQAILYFDSIAPGDALTLHFRLRAKYPIHAVTFPSRAYEYYDPEVNSAARPVALEVRKR